MVRERESDNLLRRQKESANVDGLIPDRVKNKIQERRITKYKQWNQKASGGGGQNKLALK